MKFSEIPQFICDGNYNVSMPWKLLEKWIEDQVELNLDLDPDFQRDHVWTEEQQRKYVEFCLKGGKGSSQIRFNCVGWMGNFEGPFVLVDGKQRIAAVRKFLYDGLKVFDHLYSEFEDKLPSEIYFNFMINDLPTKADVLEWYLQINDGGTVHTQEELNKVREMLKTEKKWETIF